MSTGTHVRRPFDLPRGERLSNRLAKAAMSEALADAEGNVTEELLLLYRTWSQTSGCALLITGNVTVDKRYVAEPGNVMLSPESDLDGLRAWAAAGRSGGNQLWMQLNHPGRQANALASRLRPVAPSAIAANFPGAVRPRALEPDQIHTIVAGFAAAAAAARAVGFDGVQIHAAHGYLISQFLSPLSNQRADEWGGALDNRMRFALAVVRAVRDAVGADYPVGIKLNSADFQRGGFTETESMLVAEVLAAEGVDLIEISGGSFSSPVMTGVNLAPSTSAREAYFQTYAEQLRVRTNQIPLMLTGGFRTVEAMESALSAGACDIVGLARMLCVTPSAGTTVLAGRSPTAPTGSHRIGMRWLFQRLTDIHRLDGILDVQWHTDQIHRIAAGLDPEPDRHWSRALVAAVRRNGFGALRKRRS
ncbi:NADH:flavin oxidoreductase [Nocardia sp. NPDC057440]|uniref:oxidoreductase n=1 Tax=Nocardia sp. NPDC057440 TaxID=3346134 RepID=UPI003671A491